MTSFAYVNGNELWMTKRSQFAVMNDIMNDIMTFF